MRYDVFRNLGDSAYDFNRAVWPAIAQWCGGGRLVPVESTTDRGLVRDLDILAGVDAWQMIDTNGTMRAIASRIQWVNNGRSWRTFTIRKTLPNGAMTEFEKRMRAIENPDQGWLLPAITVQAYMNEPRRTGELIEVAFCFTRDLYRFAVEHPCPRSRRNPADGVLFDWFEWEAMAEAGYPIGFVMPEHQVIVNA